MASRNDTKTAPAFKGSARNAQAESNQLAAIEQKIRERAYILWESRGRPNGNDRRDWLEAEAQVKKELRIS